MITADCPPESRYHAEVAADRRRLREENALLQQRLDGVTRTLREERAAWTALRLRLTRQAGEAAGALEGLLQTLARRDTLAVLAKVLFGHDDAVGMTLTRAERDGMRYALSVIQAVLDPHDIDLQAIRPQWKVANHPPDSARISALSAAVAAYMAYTEHISGACPVCYAADPARCPSSFRLRTRADNLLTRAYELDRKECK